MKRGSGFLLTGDWGCPPNHWWRAGGWDKAFAIIGGSLKKVEAYVAKAGLKTDGLPETIFLATDDRGFDYEAAVPLAASYDTDCGTCTAMSPDAPGKPAPFAGEAMTGAMSRRVTSLCLLAAATALPRCWSGCCRPGRGR